MPSFTTEYPALAGTVTFHGRTYSDEELGCVWFNWTCSGFSLRFRGSRLRALIRCIHGEMTAPMDNKTLTLYPVIGIHTDGGDARRIKLNEGEQWLELFEGDGGEHCIEVRKLSENAMGKCALCALETDGELLPPPSRPSFRLEFVGDSITCGYGNESSLPGFRSEDENGERSYAFLAAKEIGAEYSSVSVTGCCVTDPVCFPMMKNRGMDSLYPCCDAPLDRLLGRETREWDFSAAPSDAVVLNLGTNDATMIALQGFSEESAAAFRRDYLNLIRLIRKLNGPECLIICTLGSMDYYLWDDILAIVAEYAAESGDGRICCEKLGKLNHLSEGFGSDMHPSAMTHERMGKEMAAILRRHLGL